jgi:hypothetical protein
MVLPGSNGNVEGEKKHEELDIPVKRSCRFVGAIRPLRIACRLAVPHAARPRLRYYKREPIVTIDSRVRPDLNATYGGRIRPRAAAEFDLSPVLIVEDHAAVQRRLAHILYTQAECSPDFAASGNSWTTKSSTTDLDRFLADRNPAGIMEGAYRLPAPWPIAATQLRTD